MILAIGVPASAWRSFSESVLRHEVFALAKAPEGLELFCQYFASPSGLVFGFKVNMINIGIHAFDGKPSFENGLWWPSSKPKHPGHGIVSNSRTARRTSFLAQ